MRIKNKEIRRRRHRKEIKIKEAQKALLLQYGNKKTGGAAGSPAPKKTASAVKKPAAPKKAKE